jgi:hypothetical protein
MRFPIAAAVAMALAAVTAPAAFAQLSISLDSADPTVQIGGDAMFTGTIANTSDETIYLNFPQYEIDSPGDAYLTNLDQYFYDDTPPSLAPDQTWADTGVFELAVADDPSIAGQTFSGTFTILGGTDSNDTNNVGSVGFNVTVAAPEPGSLPLTAIAAAAAGLSVFRTARRRRRRAAVAICGGSLDYIEDRVTRSLRALP